MVPLVDYVLLLHALKKALGWDDNAMPEEGIEGERR